MFVVFAVFLAGCGASTSAPTPPLASANDSVGSSTTIPADIASQTNAERAKAGLGILSVNARLNTAAQLQADQIAALRVLEHDVPNGRYPTPQDRLAAAGYDWQRFGENLADGFSTVAGATAGWMASEGHRANILDPNFTEIGTAYAIDSTGVPYYVEVFGRPR